jgi:hypothetical protein
MRLRSENSRLNSGGASSPLNLSYQRQGGKKYDRTKTGTTRQPTSILWATPATKMGPFSNAGAKVRILFGKSYN